jgi:hypothetical protein
MLAAALVVATLANWVPARWATNDPASLDLITGTPVNCLLLEQKLWSSPFSNKASSMNIAVLGVVRPGSDVGQSVRTAKEQGLQGIVLEGDFDSADTANARKAAVDLSVIEMPSRRSLRFDSSDRILATGQGVWPGIQVVDEKDKAHAMPSGGPWIDTNTGFLRYARAMHRGEFWMGVTPPPKQVYPLDRYLMVIGDAAMVGARWVVALDEDFSKRLQARDANAIRDWKRIGQHLKFFEDHRADRDLPIYGQMALIQDAVSGALLSGSVLDMIAVKHTPVRPVPGSRLSPQTLDKATMALNVDPASLTPQQSEVLKNFTRGGGTVLNGPPEWKMPATSKNQLTVDEADVKKLDDIWKDVNNMINRRNLGVRLFNVSSMLSFLQSSADSKRAVLQLVNYSGYPVENVTAHVLGRFKKATIYLPEGATKSVETYDVEEGVATGLDIATVPAFARIVLEH